MEPSLKHGSGGTGGGQGGKVNIPTFATGTPGWISPPRLSIVGEGGEPEILEYEKGQMRITPISGMDIIPASSRNIATQNGGEQHIHIHFDGEVLVWNEAHFYQLCDTYFIPRIQELLENGIITIPRRSMS